MQAIDIHDFDDLGKLAKAVDSLSGVATDGLFVYFEEGWTMPVFSEAADAIVGEFFYYDEQILYRALETPRQPVRGK